MAKDKRHTSNTGESTENISSSDKERSLVQMVTNHIIDSFINALKSGDLVLGNKGFGELFIDFLRERNYNLIDKLKAILGKEDIDWKDIKDLYLESGSTLEDLITKEIFKNLKLKDATRGVVDAFIKKLQDIHSDQQYQNRLNELKRLVNSVSLSTEQDVENFLDQVKQYFEELIRLLPTSKLKNKVKKIKVTNEEIIKSLLDLNIINQDEAFFISGGEIGSSLRNVNEDTKKKAIEPLANDSTRKEQLEDLLQNLLIANTIDFIYNSKEKFDKTILFLKNGFRISTLGEIINFSEEDFLNWVRNNPSFLNLLSQNESCNSFLYGNKEEYSECLNYVLKNLKQILIAYIKSKDQRLGQIFEKVFDGEELDQDDKIYLIEKFYGQDYKKRLIDTMVIAYDLDNNDREKLKNIIDKIFDLQTDEIEIPHFDGNTIKIKLLKDIVFCKDGCQINNIVDFWDLYPEVKFKIEFSADSPIVEIFKDDLLKIKDKIISPYQRVRLRLDNNEEIEGYINLFVDKDGKQFIEVLRRPVYEENGEDNIIKQIPLEQVVNIEALEPLNYQFLIEDNYYKKFILLLPQLINKDVYNYLKSEEVRKKIEEVLHEYKKESEVNRDYNNVDEKNSIDKLDQSKIVNSINKELERIDGDVLLIKNLKDLEEISLLSKVTHIGIPGYEDDWVKVNFEVKDDMDIVIKFEGCLIDVPSEYKSKEIYVKELPNFLNTIKFLSKTFKFKKLKKYKDFESYFNDGAKLDLDSKYKVNREKWKHSVELKDKKMFKNTLNGRKEVKYFVKEYTSLDKQNGNEDLVRKISIFKVSFNDGGYDIQVCENYSLKERKCMKWKVLKKNVSYDYFISWIINEDNFSPFTEEEFEVKIRELYGNTNNIGSLGFNVFSISSILLSAKNIINAFKHHFEELENLDTAILYKKLVSKFPGIGVNMPTWGPFVVFEIIDELKDEANAEFDSRVMGYINKFKNRLIRADEGKGGAHGSRAAEIIKKEIFEKVEKGKDLDWRTRLKAAGYLLYALEKGPGPYFRALGNYNGKGMWIKALLGHEVYNYWKELNKDMLRRYKENPDDVALKDEIVASEIRFIYNHEKTGEIFSKSYPSMIEGLNDKLYSTEKSGAVYSDISKKGNYYDIENAFSSFVNNVRVPNVIGALKALAERVESEQHYIDIYKNLIWLGLSGFVLWEVRGEQREEFDKICRTYGYQIGTLFHNPENLKEILRLIDAIVKHKKIKLEGYNSFTEYFFGIPGLTPDKVDYYDRSLIQKSKLSNFKKKLEKLRSYAGKEIVSVLDLSDSTLFKLLDEEKSKASSIELYLNTLNEKLNDSWVVDLDNLFTTKDAPYWVDGVLNLNRRLFAELTKMDEGNFVHGPKAEAVMDSLVNRLYKLESEVYRYGLFKFLLDKYNTRFGGAYKGRYGLDLKEVLIDKIHDISEEDFVNQLWKPVYDKYNYAGAIPNIFEEALKKYLRVLYKGSKYMISNNFEGYVNLVNSIFGELIENSKRYI